MIQRIAAALGWVVTVGSGRARLRAARVCWFVFIVGKLASEAFDDLLKRSNVAVTVARRFK
jgi:hypothetical protein